MTKAEVRERDGDVLSCTIMFTVEPTLIREELDASFERAVVQLREKFEQYMNARFGEKK